MAIHVIQNRTEMHALKSSFTNKAPNKVI